MIRRAARSVRAALAARARRIAADAAEAAPARRGPLARSAAEFKQPPGTCSVCGRRPGDPPTGPHGGRFRYHGCPAAMHPFIGPPPGTRVPKYPGSGYNPPSRKETP